MSDPAALINELAALATDDETWYIGVCKHSTDVVPGARYTASVTVWRPDPESETGQSVTRTYTGWGDVIDSALEKCVEQARAGVET